MIGARAVLPGLAVLVLIGALFGLRSTDPRVALAPEHAAATQRVAERAREADDALADLEARLRDATETARRGAAHAVSGDAAPSEALGAGADLVEAAVPAAAEAHAATWRLRDAIRDARVTAASPEAPPTSAQVASIAEQLRATAEAADRFAEMRRLARSVPDQLDGALAALERGDAEAGLAGLTNAAEALEVLAAWEHGTVTLPIWLETVSAMRDALEAAARGALRGDSEAAAEAVAAYQEAAAGAVEADRALEIAISEGGQSIAEVPLRRLAAALASVVDRRAAVASLLHGAGAPVR